jgi:hypothetical protein
MHPRCINGLDRPQGPEIPTDSAEEQKLGGRADPLPLSPALPRKGGGGKKTGSIVEARDRITKTYLKTWRLFLFSLSPALPRKGGGGKKTGSIVEARDRITKTYLKTWRLFLFSLSPAPPRKGRGGNHAFGLD